MPLKSQRSFQVDTNLDLPPFIRISFLDSLEQSTAFTTQQTVLFFHSVTSFRTRHHNREQSTAFTTQQTVLFFHPLHPTPLHPHSCFFILRDVSFHISTCRYEVKSNFLPYLFLIRTGAKFLVGMLAHQQYKYEEIMLTLLIVL